MDILTANPMNKVLSMALLGIVSVCLALCVQRFKAVRRCSGEYLCAAYVVRGIRWLVIALTALAWAAGFFWNSGWLFIIGLVFIGQEMYECAFLSATLRLGMKMERGQDPFS